MDVENTILGGIGKKRLFGCCHLQRWQIQDGQNKNGNRLHLKKAAMAVRGLNKKDWNVSNL